MNHEKINNNQGDRKMFYIVEINYTGANPDDWQYINADEIQICCTPAFNNGNGEICIDGWCGTTNDWAVYAHGEYDTLEEARENLFKKFGIVRNCDFNGNAFESDDPDVIEIYKTGKYPTMTDEETASWLYESINEDVIIGMSNEKIIELAENYEICANSEGYFLSSNVLDLIDERIHELKEED